MAESCASNRFTVGSSASSEMASSSETFSWYVQPELLEENKDWFCVPKVGDAGFDLRCSEELLISPGATVLCQTGVHVAIPGPYVGLVKDRSSMASKGIVSSGGVIDAGYRGEVKVLLTNRGPLPYPIQRGDRIAQLVVLPCLTHGEGVSSLEDLGATSRGAGGFGSTGR